MKALMRALCAAVPTLLLATAAYAQPASPEELAAAVARPSIVLVTVSWHGWVRDKQTGEVFGGTAGYDVRTTCTGAVIHPDGYVATASHCVHTGVDGGSSVLFEAAVGDLAKAGRIGDPAKAKQALAERALAEGAGPDLPVERRILVDRMVADGQRDSAPATVVDLVAPDDGDVAVLKVPRDHLPAIDIRPDAPPVGTPVLAVGYPAAAAGGIDENLEPSNKNGQISAHRTLRNRPFYEFSAAATNGMSGGPLVDNHGRVVGLVSQKSPGETQSFNFAAAATTLQGLLRDKGIRTDSPDRDYRAGLDEYFAGDLDAAIERFDAALDSAPTHVQAASYRRKAIEQGGSPGSGGTLLLILVIACGGITVAAAAMGFAGLAGRRRLLSTMDTPPYGFPIPPAPVQPAAIPPVVRLLPAALGDQPQHDSEGDTDKVDRRDLPLGDDQTDHQTRSRDTDVQPRPPLVGEPGPAQPDQGDDGEDRTERQGD
ncbi:MAG: serine protease [Kibdelosporangium sp.]